MPLSPEYGTPATLQSIRVRNKGRNEATKLESLVPSLSGQHWRVVVKSGVKAHRRSIQTWTRLAVYFCNTYSQQA